MKTIAEKTVLANGCVTVKMNAQLRAVRLGKTS